jgi:hypothetical protein
VRYVELSEDFIDSTIANKPLLNPANPPAAPTVVNDTIISDLFRESPDRLPDWRLARQLAAERSNFRSKLSSMAASIATSFVATTSRRMWLPHSSATTPQPPP